MRRRTAETAGTAASAVAKGVEKTAGKVEKTAGRAGKAEKTTGRAGRSGTRRAPRGSGGITVPVLTPKLTVHRLQIPTFGLSELGGGLAAAAGRTVAGSVSGRLPSKERLGYYAGLGALAAVGVIEWPVAAVIGVGMAVARRTAAQDRAERRPSSTTRSVAVGPRAAAKG